VDATPDMIRGVASLVEQFELLGAPSMAPVSARDAVEYSFTFLYRDRLGNRGLPVRNRTVVVFIPPLLFTFNMLDVPAQNVDAHAQFDRMRDSIVLA
jgi:hypothetical protein